MISLNHRDKFNLKLFAIFVILAEMVHVYINNAPPLYLRLGYVFVYIAFCLSNLRLIPFFTAINLIIERFSISFGEFLPNTLWFHVIILFWGYSLKFRNDGISIHRVCNIYDYIYLIFLLGIAVFGLIIHIATITDTGFIASIIDLVSGFYTTSGGYVDRLKWKDSNYISFFVGLIFLLSLFLAKRSSKRKKMFYTTSVVITSVAICLLISRGTILFLAVALVYYFRKDVFKWSFIKYYLLIFLIICISYQFGFLDNIIYRFTSDDLTTGSGRTNIWREGIATFSDKDLLTIIFGAGAGQSTNMVVFNDVNWSPHNNYLEMLFDYGILGVLIFVFWLMSLFFTSKTNEKQTMMIYIILSCITIVPFIYVVPIWIILPVIMVLDNKILKYE